MIHGRAGYTHHWEGVQAFTVELDVECEASAGRLFGVDSEKTRIELLEVARGWRPVGISEVVIEREEARKQGSRSSSGRQDQWDAWICHGSVLMEHCPGPIHLPLLVTHVRLSLVLYPDGSTEGRAPVVKTKALRL
jgi:hypothetical protein